jgi:hypothetical protein
MVLLRWLVLTLALFIGVVTLKSGFVDKDGDFG